MQPSPRAETSRLLCPSFLFFIVCCFGIGDIIIVMVKIVKLVSDSVNSSTR
jgi:hypothetical protein